MSVVQDSLTILAFLVIGVFASILVIVIVDAVDDAFAASDIAPVGKDIVHTIDTQIPPIVDWIIPLLFIGLPLISLGLAFTNYIPPVFYWLAALASFVISIIGFVIQDLWNEFIGPQILADAASTVPVTSFLFSNMGYYALVIWLVIAIGSYAKIQGVGLVGAYS